MYHVLKICKIEFHIFKNLFISGKEGLAAEKYFTTSQGNYYIIILDLNYFFVIWSAMLPYFPLQKPVHFHLWLESVEVF